MIDTGKTGRRYYDYLIGLKDLMQSKKNRSLTWLAITVFSICFVMVAIIRPTLLTIVKLQREIRDKKELTQKLQAKIDAIVRANEQYAKVVDDLSLLDEALPQTNQFPKFAFFLEQIGPETGISFSSLNFEKIGGRPEEIPKGEKDKTNYVNFSLSAESEYQNLKKFLESLESSRRIINIENVSFTKPVKRAPDELPILTMSVTGKIFFTEKI